LLTALRHQISSGSHVAGFDGDRLVGYCGWILTTKDAGEAWLREETDLTPCHLREADSAALTTVRIVRSEDVRALIRACRSINPGRRIFFKRDYRNSLRSKKSTVLNRASI
jgi:hypothetical protein